MNDREGKRMMEEDRKGIAGLFEKGNAFIKKGTPEALKEAIVLFSKIIDGFEDAPMDNPEYCNDLAAAYVNRGNALQEMGTVESFQQAVQSYNQAIGLRKDLPMDNSEYRNNLAAAYMNRGNALLRMGTMESLQQAVQSYDQAIGLQKDLPMDNPEYRNDLAGAYANRGTALKKMGTMESLQQAVQSHDQAIGLRKDLPMDNSEYRNDLAGAYANRGNALQEMNTMESLQQAVQSHDQAIGLRKDLPMDNPEYRNDLARDYTNRGTALKKMGTMESLQQAVQSHDQAIGLRKDLPMDNSEYRNDLAGAYANRGNALQEMNTMESLQQAVQSYDQAIGLGKDLPMDNPKYRNDLAADYMNRGHALQKMGTMESLQQAVQSYDQAIALTAEIDRKALAIAKVTGMALTGKAVASLNLGFSREMGSQEQQTLFEAAADAADDGLDILRELETAGSFVLRSLRESFFDLCLNAYGLWQPHFVPEIVLDHLDPESPGSAPESSAMHHAALRALVNRARQLLREDPGEREPSSEDDNLTEVYEAIGQVLAIRVRYFAGTADSVRLQAAYHELSGNMEKARQVLKGYIRKRPRDPEGRLAMADFLCRKGVSEAGAAYEMAGALLVENLPETPSSSDQETAAQRLAAIADTVCHLLFGTWPSMRVPNALQQVNARFEGVWTWMTRFEKKYEDRLAGALSIQLEDVRARLRQEQQEWFQRYEVGINIAAREDASKELDTWREEVDSRWKARASAMVRTFLHGISFRREFFVDALLFANQDLWAHYESQWDAAYQCSDTEEMARIQEEIAQALSRVLAREAGRVSSSEMADERELAEQALGVLWPALEDGETRALLAGVYCLKNSQVHQFAGLAFGQVVETAISNRVMQPLRYALAKAEKEVASADGHGPAAWATDFLNRKRDHLMLGQLAGILNKVLYSESVPGADPDGALALIRNHLLGLPGSNCLVPSHAEIRKARKDGLNHINQIRIKGAHTTQDGLSLEEVRKSWELLAVEPDVAFLHYFVGAHLPAEEPVDDDASSKRPGRYEIYVD